jgi:predicted dinucleotide-binding enzyme
MRIAVMGTGRVGGTLGRRWAQTGHSIVFGTRDPASEKVQALLREAGPHACAASLAEAVAAADIVVLATPWPATQAALRSAGDLSGKILLDATNPIKDGALDVGHTASGSEQVAAWAPGARVVKALNTTGAGNMANPDYGGQRPTMFLCGDDAEAKALVTELIDALGFEALDSGPLSAARYLEPLAMLWVALVRGQGLGPDIAFKLLRR